MRYTRWTVRNYSPPNTGTMQQIGYNYDERPQDTEAQIQAVPQQEPFYDASRVGYEG